MKRIALLVIAVLVAASSTTASAIGNGDDGLTAAEPPSSISMADYHGRIIDLREGWGTAEACYVSDSGTSCFDSEAEMDRFIDAAGPAGFTGGRAAAARLVLCGSTLRLYDAISYGTPMVAIQTRLTVISLSAIGFDNRTTSYKVGACSATMWDGAAASGSVYPGNTSAGTQQPSMVAGWNNVIGSVYLA